MTSSFIKAKVVNQFHSWTRITSIYGVHCVDHAFIESNDIHGSTSYIEEFNGLLVPQIHVF